MQNENNHTIQLFYFLIQPRVSRGYAGGTPGVLQGYSGDNMSAAGGTPGVLRGYSGVSRGYVGGTSGDSRGSYKGSRGIPAPLLNSGWSLRLSPAFWTLQESPSHNNPGYVMGFVDFGSLRLTMPPIPRRLLDSSSILA